jgi:hypothetical protein
MKDTSDLIVCAFYGLLGALLGLLIFAFALDGWSFLLAGRASKSWNGAIGLIVCCAIGGGLGLLSYHFSDREFGSRASLFFDDQATALLFVKRLLVIAGCVAVLYFLWGVIK